MVNIETYQTLAVADTLQATLRQYENALSRTRTAADVPTVAQQRKVEGRLVRIGSVVHQGSTLYYLVVNSDSAHLFVAAGDLSESLPLARDGDAVAITVDDNQESNVLTVTQFTDHDVHALAVP